MKSTDVHILNKETPFKGYFHIDRYRLRHKLFSGSIGAEINREVFERGHAAACLLYDPELDLLVMIEQFRIGALAAQESPWYSTTQTPWLIEIVAGIIEHNETPESVIRREALEEADCEIHEIEPICHYFVSPGGSTESVFTFCGRIDASNAGGTHGLVEEGEDIRVFTIRPEHAFDMLAEGKICNSMTMIPLYWFKDHRNRLRHKWCGK
ncbi:MAG: hypothetical protein CBB68_11665 [Rhodospirillaceae bacterium TMED8]|nr:ADP-ribose diphosphatase [Magnetovibrio sp.]OUT49648.1 MAG: hypothetical protein CBB68_11665 [Rhodospirillaceae bacterium TMED8]